MRTAPIQIVKNGNMNADVTSAVVSLNQIFGYAIQANFATGGTLGGTFTLQASLDYAIDNNGNVINAGTWNTVDNTSQTIAAAGSFTWNIGVANYPFVRLVYTHHSGDSGTLNAFAFIRGF